MRLADLRIKTKLFLLIGFLAVVTCITAADGIMRLMGANATLHEVYQIGHAQILAARMNQNLIVMNRSEYRVAADPTIETVRSGIARSSENRKMFEERFEQLRAEAHADEIAMLDKISAGYQAFDASVRKTMDEAVAATAAADWRTPRNI